MSIRTLCVGLVALSLSACRSATAPKPSPGLLGTWALASVNGQPLPYTMAQDSTGSVVLIADSFTYTDSGFTETADYHETQAGIVTDVPGTWSGPYRLQGNDLTLYYPQMGVIEIFLWPGGAEMYQTGQGLVGQPVTMVYGKQR